MSTLKVDTFLSSDGTLEWYKCRAFVCFDASSGTPIIDRAGNVSSITDNGEGSFTANFTNDMPNADYVSLAGSSGSAIGSTGNQTTTSCSVQTRSASDGTFVDRENSYLAVFSD